MLRFLIAYVATAVVFLGLDSIWLTLTASRLYRPVLGDMMAPTFQIAPAVVFYPLFFVGVIYFAVAPALAAGDWTRAAFNGAFFGLLAYGTYDLTNQATLKQWSTTLTIADMAWGAVVSGVSATAGYAAANWFATRMG